MSGGICAAAKHIFDNTDRLTEGAVRFIYLGKRIRIGTEMPALLYVCAVSEGAGFLLLVLCAAAVHELGHIAAAALLGRRFNSATVSLSGADISASRRTKTTFWYVRRDPFSVLPPRR